MKCKVRSFILDIHYSRFTTVSMPLVFDFFQIYLKRFRDLIVDDFVKNFTCYLLVIKTISIIEIRKKKS